MNVRNRTTIVLICSIIIAVGICAAQLVRAQRDPEVKQVFERFKAAFDSKDFVAAFDLMTPSYKNTHSLAEFKNQLQSITPLESNWTVLQEKNGKVRLCCRHPGIWFSPNSTMTYVLEEVDGEWRLTGESEMWLD